MVIYLTGGRVLGRVLFQVSPSSNWGDCLVSSPSNVFVGKYIFVPVSSFFSFFFFFVDFVFFLQIMRGGTIYFLLVYYLCEGFMAW